MYEGSVRGAGEGGWVWGWGAIGTICEAYAAYESQMEMWHNLTSGVLPLTNHKKRPREDCWEWFTLLQA